VEFATQGNAAGAFGKFFGTDHMLLEGWCSYAEKAKPDDDGIEICFYSGAMAMFDAVLEMFSSGDKEQVLNKEQVLKREESIAPRQIVGGISNLSRLRYPLRDTRSVQEGVLWRLLVHQHNVHGHGQRRRRTLPQRYRSTPRRDQRIQDLRKTVGARRVGCGTRHVLTQCCGSVVGVNDEGSVNLPRRSVAVASIVTINLISLISVPLKVPFCGSAAAMCGRLESIDCFVAMPAITVPMSG
jgi:hypothetical protein